jgi:hypothetical protein
MSETTQPGLFVHHVFFWLKNPDSETDKQKLIEGLKTLVDIPGYITAHIGFPANTNRPVIDRSYAVSWLILFNNGEEEATYQNHPVHLKFVEEYSHLWERVVVYDSEGPALS